MLEVHPLRIESPERSKLESVAPEFIKEKLLWAREMSWKGFEKIKAGLKEGMTEHEAMRLAMTILEKLGVDRHWHKPFIRFGPGTTLTFHEPLQSDYRLQKNDPVFVDIGPVWKDNDSEILYEGDVGDSFVFGNNLKAEKCAQTARDLFSEVAALWKQKSLSGDEIYHFLKGRAVELGYQLIENVDGHRISDFPHQKYSRERLAKLKFDPAPLLWVLEVHIRKPNESMGAFYEDILDHRFAFGH
ncbi:MAG: hypothetical protein JWQ35_270 [Bacteriovoracaceae bacterium]|nr:hypothetical protein [Bacteriovoracaceae bacterium]